MTSSSSPPPQCGLDTMILVYSLLQGHPAATACERLLRAHAGWFTSPWVLFEAKAVLLKISGRGRAAVAIYLDPSTHNHHIPCIGWFGRAAQCLDLLGTTSTERHEHNLIHVEINDLIEP